MSGWSRDQIPTRFISPYTPINGILFVIFPFETNFNFLRRQIRLSILGCLGDLNNASLSNWRHKKVHLIFNYKLLIIRKAWRFKSIDFWNYISLNNIELQKFKKKICVLFTKWELWRGRHLKLLEAKLSYPKRCRRIIVYN